MKNRAKITRYSKWSIFTVISFLGVSCSTINSVPARSYAIKDGRVSIESVGMITYSLATGIITIKGEGSGESFKITEVSSNAITDKQNTFNARFTTSFVADDKYHVQLESDSQLLESIVNSYDDKTVSVLESAAKSISTFTNSTGGANFNGTSKFEITFDPTSSSSIVAAELRLKKLTQEKGVSLTFASGSKYPVAKKLQLDKTVELKNTVLYKPLAKDLLLIKSSSGRQLGSYVVTIPRNDLIMALVLKRKALVKVDHDIKFAMGSPVNVKSTSPSQAVQVASLPLKVVDAIISTVPLEFRFDSAKIEQQKTALTEQKGLVDAQKKLLISQKELIDTQQEILKAVTN